MTSGGSLLTQLEVLCSLQTQLLSRLTFLAFQAQHNLSGGLGLFVKDRLGLAAESHLLGVVPALALGKVGRLAGLVLRHLVHFVLLALATAVRFAFFRNVDHI